MDTAILDKIKKLLRLGQSSNRHEAELAVSRAFELAARHNIDLADVDLDDETRRILHKEFHIGERFSLIRKLTINILMTFFKVNIVLARPVWRFVGTETDIEIAIYIHEFLTAACSRSLREFERAERRKLSVNKRNNFIAGFMYGISSNLRDAKEQMAVEDSKTAVALRDKENRDKYVDDHWKTHYVDWDIGRKNRDALMEGFHAGDKTQISKGLDGKSPGRFLLTE
jgi:hypothetical protein